MCVAAADPEAELAELARARRRNAVASLQKVLRTPSIQPLAGAEQQPAQQDTAFAQAATAQQQQQQQHSVHFAPSLFHMPSVASLLAEPSPASLPSPLENALASIRHGFQLWAAAPVPPRAPSPPLPVATRAVSLSNTRLASKPPAARYARTRSAQAPSPALPSSSSTAFAPSAALAAVTTPAPVLASSSAVANTLETASVVSAQRPSTSQQHQQQAQRPSTSDSHFTPSRFPSLRDTQSLPFASGHASKPGTAGLPRPPAFAVPQVSGGTQTPVKMTPKVKHVFPLPLSRLDSLTWTAGQLTDGTVPRLPPPLP